jgi:hypothetical protein
MSVTRGGDKRFRGHRRQSFIVANDDIEELTELRARQRTFDGNSLSLSLSLSPLSLTFQTC